MGLAINSDDRFISLDYDTVHAIEVFTETKFRVNVQKGVTDMCKAWEQQKQEGRIEGREEGRAQGRAETYYFLVGQGKLDIAEAAGYLGISEDVFISKMGKAGFKIPQIV